MKTIEIWKEELAFRLKKEMKAQKMSQSQLGEKVNMTRTNVNLVLNLKGTVGINKLVELAHALGLEVNLNITKPRRGSQ